MSNRMLKCPTRAVPGAPEETGSRPHLDSRSSDTHTRKSNSVNLRAHAGRRRTPRREEIVLGQSNRLCGCRACGVDGSVTGGMRQAVVSGGSAFDGQASQHPDNADRGYDLDEYRRLIAVRGVKHRIARRGEAHGSLLSMYGKMYGMSSVTPSIYAFVRRCAECSAIRSSQ
jgi:hypothetical protein